MDYVTKQIEWFLPVTFIAIANAAEIWILVSLIYYGLKTKKWKERNEGCVDKLSSRNKYTALVACAAICVIYSLLSLVFISVGFNLDEDELCDSLADVTDIFYGFVQVAVYMFLWLRQRSFYTNQMLNITYSKTAKVFSGISIVIFLSAGTVVTRYHVTPNNHFSSLNGCFETPTDTVTAAWISVIVVLVFGQTTLLGLFFYALTKTGNQEISIFARLLEDSCCCSKQNTNEKPQAPENKPESAAEASTSAVSNRTVISVSRTITLQETQHSCFSKNSKSAENIRKVMRKTLLLAIISVLSDLFTQIFVHYISIPNFNHVRFSVIAGNLSALLSLLLIVFSFTVYKKMLSSPCSKVASTPLNHN